MCDFSTRLIAWHDGELPDDEAAAAQQHVRVCSECRGQLNAYKKVSGMVSAYCDAALASKTHPSGMPHWAPVLGAAASLAILLMLFTHTHVARSLPNAPAPAIARAAVALAPLASAEPAPATVNKPALPSRLLNMKVRKHSAVIASRIQPTTQDASRMPAEPAIQISIPGEAIFPPGALPEGIDFVADVNLAADGSAQRLRLQPRLAGFEGGSNQ